MRLVSSLFLSALVLGPLAGCGPAGVVRSTRWNVVERLVSIRGGDAAAPEATRIVRGDPYLITVALSPKATEDATEQTGRWVFYKDDHLFGRLEASDIDLSHPPTVLALDAQSAAKRPGSYKYELYVDDELVTEVPVEIVAPPRFPAP